MILIVTGIALLALGAAGVALWLARLAARVASSAEAQARSAALHSGGVDNRVAALEQRASPNNGQTKRQEHAAKVAASMRGEA